MIPLIDQEQAEQEDAAHDQVADHGRVEPVQPIALHQRDHDHADRRHAEQQAAPVELAETLKTQRVLRQAIGDGRDADQAEGDHLPEYRVPAEIFEAPGAERRAHVGPEGRGERIGAEPVDFDLGRQVAKCDRHQQRRQRAARKALYGAQHIEDRQVRRIGRYRAEDGEEPDHRDGEAADREGDAAPRREGHGGDLGRLVDRRHPCALVMAEAHRALDVIELDFDDMLVEAGHQHSEQHADQAEHEAEGEGRRRRGGWGRRRRGSPVRDPRFGRLRAPSYGDAGRDERLDF